MKTNKCIKDKLFNRKMASVKGNSHEKYSLK